MTRVAGDGGKGLLADRNVTPLIDVLLVLIIMFMVITPLTPRGLDAFTPHPSPKAGAHAVVISVDATGNIRINQEVVALRDLQSRLRGIYETRNDRTVFLKCDPSLAFSRVAGILDLAKGAGIDQVGLVTDRISGRH